MKTWHKMMTRCYEWALSVSMKDGALWWLAAIAFIESSIFPIPPDVFLIPIILARRDRAFMIAGICTVASVLGGYFGYFIGYELYDWLAAPLLEFYHYEQQFETFRGYYNEWGAWIVAIGGFTPFPYKIITIASGASGLDLWTFTIFSILARGARFYLIALLLYKFGEPMKTFIEKNLAWLSILFFVLLIGSFLLIKYL